MIAPTFSYHKVPYDLRPSKQIERRMIIDALQRLSEGGFRIREYQYTGMGSIYFVDFTLFHRYLGIHRMLSVEHSPEIKRVQFNKPYRNIQLNFGPIGGVIPTLDRDLQHILWLDYDNVLNKDILIDVVNAFAALSKGSIVLLTIDVEPPIRDGKPKQWMEFFEQQCGTYFDTAWKSTDFVQSKLLTRNVEILISAIRQGLAGRANVDFSPLFNLVYADGHKMLTIGGMIAGPEETIKLKGCNFSNAIYCRNSFSREPYRIPLVIVTRKERTHLDAAMPAKKGWIPKEFELDPVVVSRYSEIYRYFPVYAELLI